MSLRSVCVFCGSSVGRSPVYRDAAEQVGRLLASRGMRLVYGGGNVGLMGVLADSALNAGAVVIGVIPKSLEAREVAHHGITELRIVESMHERKAMMVELSDEFITLPGAMGSMDETFEIMTWSQLGIHTKAFGLLNVAGYYDALLAQLDHFVVEGFVKPEHREMLIVRNHAESLLDALAVAKPRVVEKWLDLEQA